MREEYELVFAFFILLKLAVVKAFVVGWIL